MGMLAPIRMREIAEFESPHVVTQFTAGDQSRFDQIGEIPQDCRFIEAQGHQIGGDIGMCGG